jgi:hypothetical protein
MSALDVAQISACLARLSRPRAPGPASLPTPLLAMVGAAPLCSLATPQILSYCDGPSRQAAALASSRWGAGDCCSTGAASVLGAVLTLILRLKRSSLTAPRVIVAQRCLGPVRRGTSWTSAHSVQPLTGLRRPWPCCRQGWTVPCGRAPRAACRGWPGTACPTPAPWAGQGWPGHGLTCRAGRCRSQDS